MSDPGTLLHSTGRRPVDRLVHPFRRFSEMEGAGGMLLLLCTVAALVLANSGLAGWYHALLHTEVAFEFGGSRIGMGLLHWINDALMAVFFFSVGLEIKREVIAGELASLRKAALPIAGALGGMLLPAAIYTLFNAGGAGVRGWGIPMATDIAFALGVLALLGRRIPPALFVFLAALAIADDLGAVITIAIFYTSQLSASALLVAATLLGVAVLANRIGVRHPIVYALVGVGVWFAVLQSGIHATIAGVLMAMTVPARTRIDTGAFSSNVRRLLKRYDAATGVEGKGFPTSDQNETVQALEVACEFAQTPLQRMERRLHTWVAYLIMPVFALANAGVSLPGDLGAILLDPIALGVIAGLALGKSFGITGMCWLAVRCGVAELPEGAGWRLIYGVAWLGGIGFTMSLFIAGLAFPNAGQSDVAKVGILAASLLSGLVGYLLLRFVAARNRLLG